MDAWTAAAGWVLAIVTWVMWARDYRRLTVTLATTLRLLEQYRISRAYWRKQAGQTADDGH